MKKRFLKLYFSSAIWLYTWGSTKSDNKKRIGDSSGVVNDHTDSLSVFGTVVFVGMVRSINDFV